MYAHAKSNILGFSSAKCNFRLQFACSVTWTTAIGDQVASGRQGQVRINISIQVKFIIGLKDSAMSSGSIKMAPQIFDCILVNFVRIVDKARTLMNSQSNFRMRVL